MYTWEDFAASLLTGSNGALPYIGAAVVAGAVILACAYGIGQGIAVIQRMLEEREADRWAATQREEDSNAH